MTPAIPARAAKFLASCADGSFGFLPRRGSRPAYLEHVHSGIRLSLLLSLLLGEMSRWGEACRDFVLRCARPSGGFLPIGLWRHPHA